MWSSVNGDPYMSYTIHYITEEWELQSIALGTLYFPEDHTGEIYLMQSRKHFSHGILTAKIKYVLLPIMVVMYCALSKQFLGGHTCHALVIIFILQLDTP